MLIPIASSTTSLLATASTISSFSPHPQSPSPTSLIPSSSLTSFPHRLHIAERPSTSGSEDYLDEAHHHAFDKRHYYLCEGATLTWQGEWYAAPFYTASGQAATYDAAAATGPVQPPAEILGEARECAADRTAWRAYTSSLAAAGGISGGGAGGTGTSRTGGGAISAANTASAGSSGGGQLVLTTISGTPVFTQVSRASGILTGGGSASKGSETGSSKATASSLPTVSASASPGTSISPSPGTASLSSASSEPASSEPASSASPTSPASPSPSPGIDDTDSNAEPNGDGQSLTSGSENICAGQMDFQAWSAVASAFLAVLLGGIIWALWAVLKGVKAVYAPVAGSTTGDLPSKFNLLTFLSPFTLPSSPSILAVPAAALHLGAFSAILSLGAALPFFISNIPCLAYTSPPNTEGGRLGMLTDLSLMRLLNALDPSPGSDSRLDSLTNVATATSSRASLGDARQAKRALSDTIAPAISSARARLIVLLVLIGLLTLVGGLWLVARVYRRLEHRWRKAEEEAHGMDMLVLGKEEVPGWSGGEEALRKRLVETIKVDDQEESHRGGPGDGKKRAEVDVLGVFAIPDTTHLCALVDERSGLLVELERAEQAELAGQVFQPRLDRSIISVSLDPPRRSANASQQSPSMTSRTGSHHLLDRLRRSMSPSFRSPAQYRATARSASPEKGESRFHEINRNSLMLGSGRFEIGQRLRIDEEGRYVPVAGSSEDAHALTEEGDTPSDETPSSGSRLPAGSIRQVDADTRDGRKSSGAMSLQSPRSTVPPISPGPLTSTSARSLAAPSSHVPSLRLTPTHLVDLRNRLRMLNEAVNKEQKEAFRKAAVGEGVLGWTVVGRGLRHLRRGNWVMGRTLQDIRWDDVGKESGMRGFIMKVIALEVCICALSIPTIGLTLASSPGFAYYLPFLGRLGRSSGLGSGIAQGLIPALVLTLGVVTAVWLTQRFARCLNLVSEVARDQVAHKATFWLLLSLCTVWAVLVSSLEHAVRAFNLDVQEARFVGDGAIFASWWIFILLINICLVIPGLYILQPMRLYRFWRSKQERLSPREAFRARVPPMLKPAYLLAPSLIGIFYALSLSLIFPLLSIPILVLLYLSLIVVRYLSTNVSLEHAPVRAHSAELAMWTIRRVGWCLAIQPALFGLISLSRREWAIGGVALGVAVLAVLLVESFIGRKESRRTHRAALGTAARQALDKLEHSMAHPPETGKRENRTNHMRQPSNSSLLMRIADLLPGYSRLPPGCPVPFDSMRIDDEYRTELAARSSLDNSDNLQDEAREVEGTVRGTEGTFYDPTRANRGLVYPREMLLPDVVVWLPRVEGADRRAAELEEGFGLPVVLDAVETERGGKGKGKSDGRVGAEGKR